MNGIARKEPIYSFPCAADQSAKVGQAVYLAAGVATLLTSATANEPYGVIIAGADTATEPSSIVPFAGAGAAGAVYGKLDATPGTIVAGSNLVVTATGTFILDPGTGARWTCAQAQESGVANELIEMILFKPVLGS